MTKYDVIIIGSGPAGLTAAIYAARANLKAVIFEAEMPGGKLTKTYEIANYPGIQNINGADLAMQMMEHAAGFGVETNILTLITPDGMKELPRMSKDDAADALLDAILERMG